MSENRWRANLFFKKMSDELDLQLSGVLKAISTKEQLQGLNHKELPYLQEKNMATFSLQTGVQIDTSENKCCYVSLHGRGKE